MYHNGLSCEIDQHVQNDDVKVDPFIHMNRFQPLSDIDPNIVNNFHSAKANTVVENTEGRRACRIPVATETALEQFQKVIANICLI